MKKLIFSIALLCFGVAVLAQSPNLMSYQAIIRNASNQLIVNAPIGVRVSILQGSATGTVVFRETYNPNPTTNSNGLLGLNIGSGVSVIGSFAQLNWSQGPYFVQVEADPSGGTNYSISSVSQLLSVPYALHARTADVPGLPGPQGPQGPIGLTGPAGPQGPAGSNGAVGPQGPIGLTGPQGPQGIQGAQGPVGSPGPQGSTGASGVGVTQTQVIGDSLFITLSNGLLLNAGHVRGLQGVPGSQGPIGLTGPQGVQGAPGNTGPAGPQGPAGNDGAVGPQGPIGLTGPQGVPGNDGAVGPQGPIGLTGPQGVPGNDGAVGTQGPIGLTGPQGVPGNDGAVGPQGPIGLTGPQGPAGSDGAVGPQGPIGLTGPQGVPGNDGAVGPQGPIGLTGPQGPAGSNGATGPQGPIGLTGPQGPAGSDGALGPQGPIGLTGPQGPIGLTGLQGPQGVQGATGNIGPVGPQGIPGTNGIGVTQTNVIGDSLFITLSNGQVLNAGHVRGTQGTIGGLQPGSQPGQLLYWNGTAWVSVPPGNRGQSLIFCDGIPTWGGCFPIVSTSAVTNLNLGTPSIGGNVTSDGGSMITARGIVYGNSTSPTLLNSFTNNGTGTGQFTSVLNGLTPLSTYFARAYASNSLGTSYGNEVSFTIPLTIGATYAGGIVFYIAPNGVNGMVCAPSDQGQQSWGWCMNPNVFTSIAFGTGMSNTVTIVNWCSQRPIAASICNDLVLNGYDDWYLPSKDELVLMGQNLGGSQNLGNFSYNGGHHWSSSRGTISLNNAWAVSMDLVTTREELPNVIYRVRAVRAF